MEDPKTWQDKVFFFVTHLTWKRLAVTAIAGSIAILGLTLYENRQVIFERQTIGMYTDDFYIAAPSPKAEKVFQRFMANHPEVAYLVIIDANPVTNTREVRKRYFNNKRVQEYIEEQVAVNPTQGDGPLITANPELNQQIYAILNGEVRCAPAKDGIISKSFPDALQTVKYSCRVPIPPAYNKATGWITLQLSRWPLEDLESFKADANALAYAFYEMDVNPGNFKVTK